MHRIAFDSSGTLCAEWSVTKGTLTREDTSIWLCKADAPGKAIQHRQVMGSGNQSGEPAGKVISGYTARLLPCRGGMRRKSPPWIRFFYYCLMRLFIVLRTRQPPPLDLPSPSRIVVGMVVCLLYLQRLCRCPFCSRSLLCHTRAIP